MSRTVSRAQRDDYDPLGSPEAAFQRLEAERRLSVHQRDAEKDKKAFSLLALLVAPDIVALLLAVWILWGRSEQRLSWPRSMIAYAIHSRT